MTDHQTSPVGEDAGLPRPTCYMLESCIAKLKAGREAQGIDVTPDCIGPWKFALYTAEQVRQAQRDAVASRDAEIADLRAQLARHSLNTNAVDAQKSVDVAIKPGAAPTQPKAQVESIDTPEFRNLLGDLLECYRDELRGGPELPYEKARTTLVASIDAWAGSRAGDAAQAEKGAT